MTNQGARPMSDRRVAGKLKLDGYTELERSPAVTQLIAHRSGPNTASWLHFARHLVEMFLAMMAGMMVGAFLLATAVGTSVSEARRDHAVAWVIVMAVDMTVPMVAVMLYRGHSLRSAGEMAVAMMVPALRSSPAS